MGIFERLLGRKPNSGAVHLVAVVHEDGFDGPAKLNALLEELHPDIVLSETCERIATQMTAVFQEVVSDVSPFVSDPSKLVQLLDVYSWSWDTKASRAYAAKSGATHIYADIDSGMNVQRSAMDPFFKELIAQLSLVGRNDRKMADQLLATAFEKKERERAGNLENDRAALLRLSKTDNPHVNEPIIQMTRDIGPRDDHWSKLLRSLDLQRNKVVFPVGGLHVISGSKTLWTLIQDLRPSRTWLV